MKAYQRILIILNLLLIPNFAFSQALEPEVYARLREYVMLTAHQPSDRLKSQIDLATANPVPYLKTLAQDSSLRIYARQKAIVMLRFYQTSESEDFLESLIKDEGKHSSLRKYALKSYVDGFQAKNPARVQSILLAYENDVKLGQAVRRHLRDRKLEVNNKRTRKHPEERNPKQNLFK